MKKIVGKPPATPKRLPSHFAVKSAHLATSKKVIKGMVRKMVRKPPATPKRLPSHIAVKSAHLATSKKIRREW